MFWWILGGAAALIAAAKALEGKGGKAAKAVAKVLRHHSDTIMGFSEADVQDQLADLLLEHTEGAVSKEVVFPEGRIDLVFELAGDEVGIELKFNLKRQGDVSRAVEQLERYSREFDTVLMVAFETPQGRFDALAKGIEHLDNVVVLGPYNQPE